MNLELYTPPSKFGRRVMYLSNKMMQLKMLEAFFGEGRCTEWNEMNSQGYLLSFKKKNNIRPALLLALATIVA